MGCQVGKVYRLVLQSGEGVYAVLAVLLTFATQARKKSSQNKEESSYDRVRRLSSPRSWDVALVPFPGDFVPLPTLQETGIAQEAEWGFLSSLAVLKSRAISFPCARRTRQYGHGGSPSSNGHNAARAQANGAWDTCPFAGPVPVGMRSCYAPELAFVLCAPCYG